MPLSPNVQRIADALRLDADEAQKAGVAAFVVPDNATDEQVLAMSADRLDTAAGMIEGQTQRITALSADVNRLTSELATANTQLTAKANEVLSLSAERPQPFDPLAAEQLGEMVEATFERAIGLGLPAKFVEAVRPAIRDDKGALTVFALSGCSVPAGEGKVKASRNALVVANAALALAEGKYGQGVPTGPAKPVLQASAEAGALTEEEKKADESAKQYAASKRGSAN